MCMKATGTAYFLTYILSFFVPEFVNILCFVDRLLFYNNIVEILRKFVCLVQKEKLVGETVLE